MAMQIAESVNGRRRIVRHVGPAHAQVSLGLLTEEDRRLLQDEAQGVLDLGMAFLVRRPAMLPPPGPELFPPPAVRSRPAPTPQARILKMKSSLVLDVVAGVHEPVSAQPGSQPSTATNKPSLAPSNPTRQGTKAFDPTRVGLLLKPISIRPCPPPTG
jgi:hypothetical protein